MSQDNKKSFDLKHASKIIEMLVPKVSKPKVLPAEYCSQISEGDYDYDISTL